MKKINNPFYALYNVIDLHGFDREFAIIKVKEFISDSLKMGKFNIVIIHGRGSGILKRSVNQYLRTDKRVKEFKIDNFNDGETIVRLGEDYEK